MIQGLQMYARARVPDSAIAPAARPRDFNPALVRTWTDWSSKSWFNPRVENVIKTINPNDTVNMAKVVHSFKYKSVQENGGSATLMHGLRGNHEFYVGGCTEENFRKGIGGGRQNPYFVAKRKAQDKYYVTLSEDDKVELQRRNER